MLIPLAGGLLYQNQEMATETMNVIICFCFAYKELQRIWMDVDTRNIGSWRALEKCGFRRESMIRQGKWSIHVTTNIFMVY
jgi:ribosomal-protein-alanine N-acetyltransferase